MRKWELITDLFDSKKGEIIDDYNHFDYGACVLIKSSTGSILIEPEKYKQHFRLVEQPEFTERDMKEAMECAISKMSSYGLPVFDYSEIIATIRKRKAGR